MKILVDAHVFDGMFQGSRTYLRGLYLQMMALRPDWQFYFVAKNTKNLEDIFGSHSNTKFIELKSGNKFKRLLVELPRIIKREKVDFAHFQYIAPLQKACKYIVTTHDILFEEPRFKQYFSTKYRIRNGLLFKRSAKNADVLLTVSKYSAKKIKELYVGEQQVHVVANAVETPNETSKVSLENQYGCKNYLLYVSRLEPRKNHAGLIKAFLDLKLHKQGYQLVLIGKKDLEDIALDKLLQKHAESLKDVLFHFENVSAPHQNCHFP